MKHIDLLGEKLKCEFLCDLFETFEVQVEYFYDRTHEGLADEYRAEIPELGLEFLFNEKQELQTLFMKPVEPSDFNPFEEDDRLIWFQTVEEAVEYAKEHDIQYRTGQAEFMGEEKEWVRFEHEGYSIHYEYAGTELRMVTLQSSPS